MHWSSFHPAPPLPATIGHLSPGDRANHLHLRALVDGRGKAGQLPALLAIDVDIHVPTQLSGLIDDPSRPDSPSLSATEGPSNPGRRHRIGQQPAGPYPKSTPGATYPHSADGCSHMSATSKGNAVTPNGSAGSGPRHPTRGQQ